MTNSYPFAILGDEFKSKRVLVTGGTKGIGEAIVRRAVHRSPPLRALSKLQARLLVSS